MTEQALKELGALLAELGFKDRNCRVSITDFFDSVIGQKPTKFDPPKTRHIRHFRTVPIKKSLSDISTPRHRNSTMQHDGTQTSNQPSVKNRKQRSLSLSRPSILNLKMFHAGKPNFSASKKVNDSSGKDTQVSSYGSNSINEYSTQRFEEFIKRQNTCNSSSELHKSMKIINNSYSYLNSENSNLQKEISNIQTEICDLQKNNDLLKDFSLRLKLKTISERERLNHNTRVLVRALNNLRELHSNSSQKNCVSCMQSYRAKEQSTPMSGDNMPSS